MYIVMFKSSGREAARFLSRKYALQWIEDNSTPDMDNYPQVMDLFKIVKA